MPVDGIVRVSFQSVVEANQGANKALVGVSQGKDGTGPFKKVATATYSCVNVSDNAAAKAIEELGKVISKYGTDLDFVSISVVKHTENA